MSAFIETLNRWGEDCFVAASRQSAADINTLNHWGENFLSFAWPMLWQSSLLIVVVFALDYVLARKIRAAVRHALWLVVLVKLLLPPALALPTGATWWLWRTKPAPIVPVVNHYTVSFDQTALPDTFVPASVPIVLPPLRLSNAGWAMLASGAISAGLLLWLLFRWRRVAGNVRRLPASSDLDPILEEARQLAGLHSRIRLKLIEDKQSPAVYGLFRPVILLPRALAEKLSTRQLRAVLLHEAIHLRRGDVWINCMQTLLQIAYWWHPLLWLANARIRRVREEAVDDSVMLALRKDADAYAPTLLEVARFAFRRPLASLGLVGILESRSALRQRVERLVDFRPPRKAGLTLLSFCGIFAFSAVALPMGQGPAPATAPSPDAPIIQTGPVNIPASTPVSRTNALEMRTFKVGTNGFLFNLQFDTGLQTPGSDANVSATLTQLFTKRGVDLSPPKRVFFNHRLGELFVYGTEKDFRVIEHVIPGLCCPLPQKIRFNTDISSAPTFYEHSATEMAQQGKQAYEAGDVEEAEWELNQALVVDPGNKEAQYYLNLLALATTDRWRTHSPSDHQRRLAELDFFHLDQFGPFQHAPLQTVADELSSKIWVHIVIRSNGSQTLIDLPKLTNVALRDVLNAIVKGANQPIHYSIQDHNIVFSPASRPAKLDDELSDPGSVTQMVEQAKYAPGDGLSRQAESALNQALAVEHKEAHLDSFWQATANPSQTPYTPGRNLNRTALGYYRLDQLGPFQHAPLSVVIDKLSLKIPIPVLTLSKLLNGNQTLIDLPKMTNAALPDVLDAIVRGANQSIKYLIMDNDIVFSPVPPPANLNNELFDPVSGTKVSDPPPSPSADADPLILRQSFSPKPSAPVGATNGLEQRTFPVDYGGFIVRMREETGETNVITGFKEVLANHGVDLSPPKIIFLDGMNLLWVYATTNDLDAIGKIVTELHCPPPMLHIKARFIEVPKKFFADANSLPAGLTNGGILTAPEAKKLLRQLESFKETEEQDEPEVTTICGRQAEMRATQQDPVITNPGSIVPKIGYIEIGPVLDVVPMVLFDGPDIHLLAKASRVEWFGYPGSENARSKNSPFRFATNSVSEIIAMPNTLRAIQMGQAFTQSSLFDGQTLVLFPKSEDMSVGSPDRDARIAKFIQKGEKKDGNKVLMALVTVSLIDAKGHRIHSDNEMPFAQTGFPQQSP